MRADGRISAMLTDASVKTAENCFNLCCRLPLADGRTDLQPSAQNNTTNSQVMTASHILGK